MLKVGQTVRVHPATDLFMRGVVYATVWSMGNKWIWLKHFSSRTKHKVPAAWAGDLLVGINEQFPDPHA